MRPSSKNLLSMQKASRYIDNYGRFRSNFTSEEFTPVESFQFSLDSIECYLHYVKCLSRLKGVEVTGIRVVNAIYPSDVEEEENRNKQTVLFIPTYKNRKGQDEAFDPLYIEDGVPVNLGELLNRAGKDSPPNNYGDEKQKSSTVMFSLNGPSGSSSFLNFGKMGQPPVQDGEE